MALKNIPVQIEVDELCDSFVKDFCSQSKKFTPAEAHKITKLVRQLSSTYSEDAMSTAIERFEARMDAMEKSQSQTRWFIGIGLTLMTIVVSIVIAVTSRQPQPTQNQQPVQQQQVQPQVQQPVQPQQTVEPAEQNGQTVLP